jgi:Flp pilus assembly protein TadG
MASAKRRNFAALICRLLPARLARRFVRRQDGAAAVEFALVAAPFLALLFAILETAFVFFAGQALEAAAADTARLIMTGQAQTTSYGTSQPGSYSQDDFKKAVCARAAGLFDCASMNVDVQSYATFATVNNTPPVANGVFDSTKMKYALCGPGSIEVVTLYYPWPIYVSLLNTSLTNLNGSKRLLVATAVFRNEPFGPAVPCT